jgi:hypothetical protein
MDGGRRELLDKAVKEYKELYQGKNKPEVTVYGVLYWFCRWSEVFNEYIKEIVSQ